MKATEETLSKAVFWLDWPTWRYIKIEHIINSLGYRVLLAKVA